MNFELDPEEYGDPDSLIGIILEALRLLLGDEHDLARGVSAARLPPPIRLKDGYGPEVIWTLNIFADRALEMLLEDGSLDGTGVPKLSYVNRASSAAPQDRQKVVGQQEKESNMVIIGQPHVGGGLTTRPLGNYQVDDASLQLDDGLEHQVVVQVQANKAPPIGQADWQHRVDRARDSLNSAMSSIEDSYAHRSLAQWQSYSRIFDKFRSDLEEFQLKSSPTLSVATKRVDRQLDVINKRERFIHNSLKDRLEEFFKVWSDCTGETARNKLLTEQVIQRTDRFAAHVETLKLLKSKIELRIKDLGSKSKLRELEAASERLKRDSQELDVKVGLLLAIESRDREDA